MRRVYFMRPVGHSGPIKIGVTYNADQRLRTLSSWSPFPLEIAATIPGGENLERRFHAKFKGQHTHKEWFRWSEELQAVIDAINAGQFDIDSLPEGQFLHAGNRKGEWTPERRRLQSYWMRVRSAAQRTGYHHPSDLSIPLAAQCEPDHLSRLELYLSDPVAHGEKKPKPARGRKAA